MTDSLNATPRSRIVTLRAAAVASLFRLAGLADDPYDSRRGLVLAARGFLAWIAQEDEEDMDAILEELSSMEDGDPVETELNLPWVRPPTELQPGSPVIDLIYGGHHVILSVVARDEAARTPIEYLLPPSELPWEPSAVCCAYVQLERAGDVSVLLEGWVDPDRLAVSEFDPQRESARPLRIDDDSLQPMSQLLERLRSPAERPVSIPDSRALRSREGRSRAVMHAEKAMEADGLTHDDLERRPIVRTGRQPFRLLTRVLAGTTAVATTAAIAFALLWSAQRDEMVLARKEPLRPVIEFDVKLDSVRGSAAGPQIAYNRQGYTVPVRATTFRFGWVFQVDAEYAYLLERLSERPDGTLGGQVRDHFDDKSGLEYFIVVVADKAVPELSQEKGEVQWLSPSDIRNLQKCARDRDDEAAIKVLRTALERIGLADVDYDLRVRLVEHRGAG